MRQLITLEARENGARTGTERLILPGQQERVGGEDGGDGGIGGGGR
jgi:hypothetical protein